LRFYKALSVLEEALKVVNKPRLRGVNSHENTELILIAQVRQHWFNR
jgi:hypothetical protein